jgi:hypothetical protein
MGQAKNRKAEINNLKSKGPKMKQLLQFGAFYQDDQDDGFSFNFTDNPSMSLSKFADIVDKGAANYNNAIGVDEAWFTREMIAADLFKQMNEELVPYLCQELYGQPTQPAPGTKKVVNVTPVIGELTIFATNVKWLQDNGYLTCDNHNGMLYAYLG